MNNFFLDKSDNNFGVLALIDPDLKNAALGIFLGGLLPLPFLPFLEKYIIKSF